MSEKHWIKPPEPGIYYDVPPEIYHSWDAMSASRIKTLDDSSPKTFDWVSRHPSAPTEAMLFGSMLHVLALEPFDFAARYAVAPKADRRTKAGKAAWADFQELSAGKKVVTQADYELARAMAHAIHQHPTAPKMLAGGKNEVSIVWDDPAIGVRCKARLDVWRGGLVLDIKTTIDAHPRSFERGIWNFGYHRQAAMYVNGLGVLTGEPHDFVIVAVQKSEPFEVIARRAGESVIECGRRACERALETYKQCVTTGEWPGYDGAEGTTETLELPEWAIKQEGVVA
ncbi:MAG TPA: PD-(D/E)XK nuclease-like domain-containing protein [Phycisphaerae bacterium]|nr:PD-(D/E)XK nuclease-like domain-containing protein [Phycisphaerae bacterium]